MSANLSEMVRRRYPEKEAELAALRDCQMAGVKAGALAFAGVGAGLFGSLRLYARRVSPLALGNAIGVSVIGASVASATVSWIATGREMARLKERYAAERAPPAAAESTLSPQ